MRFVGRQHTDFGSHSLVVLLGIVGDGIAKIGGW